MSYALTDVSASANHTRIAILGAGLIGRMLAVSLHAEYEVSLFDQDEGDATQSAAYLAAAMLAPLAESADCSKEIMLLGERALQRWPGFLEQLSEPVFFQQTGSLVLAFEKDLADLQQFERHLKGEAYQRVNAAQIHDLEPELNQRFQQGLYMPNEGQLDNRMLLNAMARYLKKQKVQWHHHALIERTDAGYLHNGEPLANFDWILDCRGLGAKSSTQGLNANLRGVRGEVVRVRAPDVTLNRPVRLMHPRYPIYIAPKENNLFVIGATQLESEDTRQPTVRSALELLSACFSVHSGFAEAEILGIESGLRPAYPDNEPKIQVQGNVIAVNGLFRHGYLLAPTMVEECIHLLKGSQSDSEVTKIMPDLVQILEV